MRPAIAASCQRPVAARAISQSEHQREQRSGQKRDLDVSGGVDESRVQGGQQSSASGHPGASRHDFTGEHHQGRDQEASQHGLTELE